VKQAELAALAWHVRVGVHVRNHMHAVA